MNRKKHEYIEYRPVSFLDILAAKSTGPGKYYWGRLAYQVTIIVTQACNMRCTYCYDKSRIDKEHERRELSAEEIVSLVKEIRALGVRQIKLTGGEIFIKRGIDQILKACEGTALYLCTNGTRLGRWIPFLAELSFEQLHIHTSLDGLASHPKYARNGTTAEELLAIMRCAKEAMPAAHTSFNTVLNAENVWELEDMYPRIIDARADKWTISTPYIVSEVVRNNHPFPNFADVAKVAARLLKRHFELDEPIHLSIGCLYKYEMFDVKMIPPKATHDHPCMPNCNGARGIIIDSFGNILDCLLDNVEEKGTLRHLQEGSFINLTKTVAHRPYYQMRIDDAVQCAECRYMSVCGGGCRYNARTLFGKPAHPDPIRCSYYPLMEKHILPILPAEQRDKVKSYFNPAGKMPTLRFKSVRDILEAFPPPEKAAFPGDSSPRNQGLIALPILNTP